MCRVLAVGSLGGLAFVLPRATLAFAPAGLLVYGGPCSGFRLFSGYSPLLVTVFDMFGFALLFICVFGFLTSGHDGVLLVMQRCGPCWTWHRGELAAASILFGPHGRPRVSLVLALPAAANGPRSSRRNILFAPELACKACTRTIISATPQTGGTKHI